MTDNYGGETRLLDPRHDISQHPRNVMNWEFCGRGPSQLAIALLADAGDDATATRLATRFKFDVVGDLEDDWTLTSVQIVAWVSWQDAGASE